MGAQQVTTPVEVITSHYHYIGSAVNRGYRISDVLCDSSTELLEMRETVVGAAGSPSTGVRCDQIFLEKKQILLVFPKGSHEAPVRRRNNYVAKNRYGALVVLPGYVLSGIMYLPPRATPLLLLDANTSLPTFLGMTQPTVHGSSHAFLPPQCDVVILRRHSIESLQLTARPLPKSEGISWAEEKGPDAHLCGPR